VAFATWRSGAGFGFLAGTLLLNALEVKPHSVASGDRYCFRRFEKGCVIRRMTAVGLIGATCPEEFGRLHAVARVGQESLVEVYPGLRVYPAQIPRHPINPLFAFVDGSTLLRRRPSNRSAFQRQSLKNLSVFPASSSLRRNLLPNSGEETTENTGRGQVFLVSCFISGPGTASP
jgi:hypothetical protein